MNGKCCVPDFIVPPNG